ncbi:MAG: hypothetical protein F6K14_32370 [Symploca sp. SIO2C1]|nr:hypothetical protein [Symploca sp. SIO2C1]
MPLPADIIQPLQNQICDHLLLQPPQPPQIQQGQAGQVLRNYAQQNFANNYFSPDGWWAEGTVRAMIYRFLAQLDGNYFFLSEQLYPGDPDNRRSDIMVVNSQNNNRLGIEIKADFNQVSVQEDIDKLSELLQFNSIEFAVAIFVAQQANFINWQNQLNNYSQQTAAGQVIVCGIHS